MSGCFTLFAVLCVGAGFLFPPLWALALVLGILAIATRSRGVTVVYTNGEAPVVEPDPLLWAKRLIVLVGATLAVLFACSYLSMLR